MANEPNTDPNVNPAQGGEGGQEPDYKALYEASVKESRKWEERAKANKGKADKWDELSAGSDSIEERIAALESENKAMKDAKSRQELVAKVAAATGLPESLVATLNGEDEEALTAQAKAIADLKPKGAPQAPEAGKFPREQFSRSNAQQFGDILDQMLG